MPAQAEENCEYVEVDVPRGPGETTVAMRRVCTEDEDEAAPDWDDDFPDDPCATGPTRRCAQLLNSQWTRPYDWQNAVQSCNAMQSCELVQFSDDNAHEITTPPSAPERRKKEVAILQAGITQETPAARYPENEVLFASAGPDQSETGDPVVAASGAMVINTTDFNFPGPVRPLKLSRHYNSQSRDRSTLGSNWRHNFDVYLTPLTEGNRPAAVASGAAGRTLALHDEFGRRLYTRVADEGYYLSATGDGSTIRNVSTGWLMTAPDGNERRFNAEGFLMSDKDRFGNGFEITYQETPLFTLLSGTAPNGTRPYCRERTRASVQRSLTSSVMRPARNG